MSLWTCRPTCQCDPWPAKAVSVRNMRRFIWPQRRLEETHSNGPRRTAKIRMRCRGLQSLIRSQVRSKTTYAERPSQAVRFYSHINLSDQGIYPVVRTSLRHHYRSIHVALQTNTFSFAFDRCCFLCALQFPSPQYRACIAL
jgi:hypothetical protein